MKRLVVMFLRLIWLLACDIKRAIANDSVDARHSFLLAGEAPACAGEGGMWYCYSFYEDNLCFQFASMGSWNRKVELFGTKKVSLVNQRTPKQHR